MHPRSEGTEVHLTLSIAARNLRSTCKDQGVAPVPGFGTRAYGGESSTALSAPVPVEGLAPVVVQELTKQILTLKKIGLGILFAEQNIKFATEISDRAYVIEGGRVRYAGTMADLENQPGIKQKYLMI